MFCVLINSVYASMCSWPLGTGQANPSPAPMWPASILELCWILRYHIHAHIHPLTRIIIILMRTFDWIMQLINAMILNPISNSTFFNSSYSFDKEKKFFFLISTSQMCPQGLIIFVYHQDIKTHIYIYAQKTITVFISLMITLFISWNLMGDSLLLLLLLIL